MLKVIQGNILDFKGDAIVNAANSDLLCGGGVCGQIFKACGVDKLQAACDEFGHCDTGHAVVTPAFDHKNVKYIIHAVAPIYAEDKNKEANLYNAYYHALQEAYKLDLKDVAFPSLGTGIYGYPIKDAAKIAVRAIRDFLHFCCDEMNVTIYGYTHEDMMCYFIEAEMTKNEHLTL